jgi:hypothetical protein
MRDILLKKPASYPLSNETFLNEIKRRNVEVNKGGTYLNFFCITLRDVLARKLAPPLAPFNYIRKSW